MSTQNKNFPTFSIITITLNNLSGLRITKESIENQTLTDYEWIVIDGNSTDGSVDLLREKRSSSRTDQYPFAFISEPDDGIYDAMNKGLKYAKGQYVIFLNAGDTFASTDLLEKIEPYTQKKPDFIYGDALEPQSNRKKPVYKSGRRYKDLIWGMITHHQAMLYRRHTVRDFKMRYSLRYTISSDYDFTARFLMKAKRITYVPTPICIFEQGGISQQQAALGRKEQYIIRENLEMVAQPKNLWIYTVQFLSWHLRNLAPGLYNTLKKKYFSFTNASEDN